MTKYLKVTVDTNDADYLDQETEISPEDLEKIMPVIEAIKNFQPYKGQWKPGSYMTYDHNFCVGECLREDMGEKPVEEVYSDLPPDLLEEFQEMYCPFSEYGFHTIESIELIEYAQIEDLLK